MNPLPPRLLTALNLAALALCLAGAWGWPPMWVDGSGAAPASVEPTASGAAAAGAAAPVTDAEGGAPSRRPMSTAKQWIVVLTAFGVKPLYLALSLAAILVLWRQTAPDLTALRWGLTWFWCGEQACTVNYLAYGGTSELFEYLHNFGMAAGFAYVSWATLEGLDLRLIHYSASHERCAALALCRRCFKHVEAPCGLRRLFALGVPAAALLALLPLTADFRLTRYHSDVLGSAVCYSHTLASQWFEMRLCPAVALGFLLASWLALQFKRQNPVPWSKALLAVGLGTLGFGLLRTFLLATFHDDLMWFDTWEEWTELLFVIGAVFVLWQFRHGLLRSANAT